MSVLKNKTKSELIEEISRLQGIIDGIEDNIRQIRRVSESVDFQPDTILKHDYETIEKMLANINELVYFVDVSPDKKRTVRYIGPQVERIMGIRQHEYGELLDSIVERCHPDDLPGILDTSIQLKEFKSARTFTYRFFHVIRNEYIWIEETVYPQYNEAGVHIANIGITRDITDKKRAEQEIREKEQSLSLILNNIGEVIYYIAFPEPGKRKVMFISDSITRVFGMTKDEYINNHDNLVRFCHPDDHESIKQTTKKILSEKKPGVFKYRFRNLETGEWRNIEEKVYPRYNEKGQHIGNFGITRDLTDEFKTTRALSQSEKALAMVLNNIGDLIYHVDFFPDRTKAVRFVSENIEQIIGLKKEQFNANDTSLVDYCHPEDLSALTKAIEEVVMKRTPKTLVYRFRHGITNKYIWVEERIFPYSDEEEKVVSLFGIVRNVDALRKALVELEESDNRLIQISESSPIGIFITNNVGKLVYINKKVEEISGLNEGKIFQHAWFRRIHPDDSDRLMKKIRTAVSNKSAYADEFRMLSDVNGSQRWLRIQVSITHTLDKQFMGWVGTLEDITTTIEADRKIRESEMRFRMLAENASDIVYRYMLYPEPRYEYVSPSVKTITGFTPEEFYADPYKGFSLVHPEDVELLKQSQAIIQDHVKVSGIDSEAGLVMRWIRKDGEIIWTETRNKPLLNEDGIIIAVEGISRDITPQKKHEEALRESEERFRLLSQVAMEGIVFLEEGVIVDVNDQFASIFGYNTREELIGKPISQIFEPQKIGEKARRENATYEIKSRRHDNDKEIYLEARGQDIPFGNRMLRILTVVEITERKLAEIALAESERTYATLMANLPGVAYRCLYDEHWTTLFLSPGIEELTGYTAEDFITGKKITFDAIIHPEDDGSCNIEINRAIKNKDRFVVQYRIIDREGREKFILEKGEGIYSKTGELMFLEGFMMDITERHKLEEEQLRAQLAEETNKQLKAEIEERKRAERLLEANQKYVRLMIDSSLDMICASDNNGIITEFNRAAEKTFGYSAEEVLGKHVSFLYADPDERMTVMGVLLQQTGIYSGEVTNVRKSGEPFTAYLSASVLRNETGEVIGAMGVSRDITELKKAELQLQLQAAKIKSIFQSSSHLIYTINRNNVLTSFNENYAQNVLENRGYHSQAGLAIEKGLMLDMGDRFEPWQDYHNRALQGERLKYTIRVKTDSGKIRWYETSLDPIVMQDGTIEEVSYISHEITDKRNAEEQIKLQAAKLQAVFETSSHHIWTMDRDYCMTSFNQNQANWLRMQYGVEPAVGLNLLSGEMVSSGDYNTFWKEKLDETFKGNPQHFETATRSKNGVEVWREIYLNPILDDTGKPIEVSCIAHDITDKKNAEERLKQSVKEKEVLLKEVHHRVKNNLQVISSILNLQSSYVRDQKTLELLRESQNRIKSMAFIHESLYQTKDFSNINFSEYVENISKNLVHSYSGPENPPELHLDTGNIHLNLDTAIPCGLIINEIISNALKYAFPNNRKGNIYVSMKETDRAICISIADDGVGLPDHVDYRNTESLGLQLVVTLVEQINGKIRLDNKKGTKFVIDFINHTQS
jgi:PAS domain S-box-containing protein